MGSEMCIRDRVEAFLTAASMMIANGVDLVNAAAELGHATASTTLNIYAHQVARARAEASGIRVGAFAVLRQA